MNQALEKLIVHQSSVAVLGLGYVGLPLLMEVSKKYKVVGFDTNDGLIAQLKDRLIESENILVTSELEVLRSCTVYIICVPTDVLADKSPDLSNLVEASGSVAEVLKYDDIIIYESTVYPGCTEEVCIPILEKSGKKLNQDFTVCYAPERIVPGDNKLSLNSISRIVAASNDKGSEFIYQFYKSFITADIHVTPNIKVAEAAKMVENTQRDLNISLMNELAIIFDKLNIDTESVLEAASTKWNFHPYQPGLVGGHCISVDPFYLLHKSRSVGHEPKVIAAGRAINDYLPLYIVEKIEALFLTKNKSLKGSHILVYGLTFKENIDDMRNSKVVDLIAHLKNKEAHVEVVDPIVQIRNDASGKIPMIDISKVKGTFDLVVIAVKHNIFLSLGHEYFYNLLDEHKILFDLKRIIPIEHRGKFEYWAL